ncbi:MAG: discoidin domain-containing protein [Nitrososphaera sp.]
MKIPDKRRIGKRLFFFISGAMLMLSLPAAAGTIPYASAAPACAALQVTKVMASGNDRNVPNNTIDGKLGTRWSNLGKGSWISADLGGRVNVCYVDVAWYRGDHRQNTFTISHSSDGKTFIQDYSAKSSGTSAGLQRYDFPDVSARYVRITVNGNTENDRASITEIRVYGYVPGGGTQDTIKPFIAIDQPADKGEIVAASSSSTTATITVKGRASDTGSGIKRVEVGTESSAYQPATPKAPGDWSTWTYTRTLSIGNHDIAARATDNAGNQQVFSITVKVSQKPTPPPIIPGPSPSPLKDRFGIAEIVPTMPGGRVWTSTWDNGVSRTFGNSKNDPSDPQFLTSKNGGGLGDGSYRTSGDGILKISGEFPRMYIVDPARDWHNVEITVYGMRVSDTNIAWAGLQAHVRTAQGVLGDEDVNICDDRAYSAQLTYPGEALFEKKTNHHTDNGYAQVNEKTVFRGGMPKNVWIGYKFIVRDNSAGQVKLEMYMDMTNGLNGGTWTKVSEFTDTGRNFGAGFDSCRSGVDPALPLTASNVRAGSETGRPNIAVYFRSDGVNTDGLLYKEASVREIPSLP